MVNEEKGGGNFEIDFKKLLFSKIQKRLIYQKIHNFTMQNKIPTLLK